MKKLIILSVCLWALSSSPLLAQTGGSQTVLVTVEEYNDLTITICRGSSKSEDIVLAGKTMRQNPHARPEAIQTVLAKLFAEGYTLQGTNASGDHYVFRTTYIFTKNQ
jgi:hypothetical protein